MSTKQPPKAAATPETDYADRVFERLTDPETRQIGDEEDAYYGMLDYPWGEADVEADPAETLRIMRLMVNNITRLKGAIQGMTQK